MLDYKLLEALAMVVEEGGFERAAKALLLTQSAVSQRVRQLEDRTGQILLTRATPPRPTAAGMQLIKHYRQVRLLEENLAARDAEQETGLATRLSVGINADSLSLWFLNAVGALLEDGRLLLDLRVDDQEQTHKFMRDGEVVGCISTEAKAMQGCRVELLGRMNYRMLATPDFVRRWFADGFSLSACRHAPAVIFNRKDNLHHRFLKRALGRLPENFPSHYVPSPEPFFDMIVAGYSYGMAPDRQAQPLLENGELVELVENAPINVDLYWHSWNLETRELKRLTQLLLKNAAALL